MYKMDLNTVTSVAEALWVLLANWSEILWDSFRASVGWPPGDTRAHIARGKDVSWNSLTCGSWGFHLTDLVICGADMVRHTLETHAQAEWAKIIPSPPKWMKFIPPAKSSHPKWMKFISPQKKNASIPLNFGVAIHLIGAAKLNPSVVDLTSRAAQSVRVRNVCCPKS